jgi:flagellar M-ring protein FliF
MFGVRPALRKPKPVLVKPPEPLKALPAEAGGGDPAAPGAPGERLTPGSHPSTQIPPIPQIPTAEQTKQQEILEQVSDHLKREPAQSSRLLQSWIHSD